MAAASHAPQAVDLGLEICIAESILAGERDL